MLQFIAKLLHNKETGEANLKSCSHIMTTTFYKFWERMSEVLHIYDHGK